jgi:DNA mismatch repair ATPase MutS
VPAYRGRWLPWMLALLAALWVGALVYRAVGSWYPLILMSLLNYGINRVLLHRFDEPARRAEQAGEDLKVLGEVLNVMEQESFQSPLLQRLRASLDTHSVPPSMAVKRLGQIVEWLEARRNMIVHAVGTFIFYSAQLSMAAERWQQTFGPAIRGWLSTVGELEALAALAGYAYEHPADVVPEVSTRPAAYSEAAYFEAQGLAHPLIPEGSAVRNDITLGGDTQLIVISGTNMAGKSTFLRGIGLNAVLAQCGATVRAHRLQLSACAVGASICVLDSLQGGVSRFYAEIRRLKLLSDLAEGPVPLLFLLDELLSGTNSHDRFTGTRQVLEALVQRGAMGLITTHDLALAEIPAMMKGVARNCHFEDFYQEGELKFDYKLKPGIVRTSNALRLMQAVGLIVPMPPAPEKDQ